jgi:hypothetical protein
MLPLTDWFHAFTNRLQGWKYLLAVLFVTSSDPRNFGLFRNLRYSNSILTYVGQFFVICWGHVSVFFNEWRHITKKKLYEKQRTTFYTTEFNKGVEWSIFHVSQPYRKKKMLQWETDLRQYPNEYVLTEGHYAIRWVNYYRDPDLSVIISS